MESNAGTLNENQETMNEGQKNHLKSRPIENMTQFSHLKELELLIIITSKFDLLSVSLILNAAPYLQKFRCALKYRYERPPTFGPRREYSKQFYYHLKEVEISGLRHKYDALELAMYMLNNAVRLERMIIDFQKIWGLGLDGWGYSPNPFKEKKEEFEKSRKYANDELSKIKGSVDLIIL